jgi:hypothetical protein
VKAGGLLAHLVDKSAGRGGAVQQVHEYLSCPAEGGDPNLLEGGGASCYAPGEALTGSATMMIAIWSWTSPAFEDKVSSEAGEVQARMIL